MNVKFRVKLLAVLLTVHNRKENTINCLGHLYTQDLPEGAQMDVYMVDDGSTDGTSEAVMERFPAVTIIEGDGSLFWNRGMWTAWNTASKKKKYDFFLWLNDDTFLLDNALIEMLSLCEEKSNSAIAVAAAKSSNGNKLTYGGRVQGHIPSCSGLPSEVSGFDGNMVMIPYAVYEKLGNLDYYYRHGKGDSDYAVRAQKAGVKIYQCGDVLGICDEHEKIDNWCNPDVPFKKRWRALFQPTGMHPKEWFHYEKQINVLKALIHCMTILLRCLFPKLWIRKNKLN